MKTSITYSQTLAGIDWVQLKADLATDDFDNGRTPSQLRTSFTNSQHVVFAWDPGTERVVGKARVLTDGVCNAYLVDVWTQTAYRNRGVAREMIRLLQEELQGQHIYLQADDDLTEFYTKLGFENQPNGMCTVIGKWLDNGKSGV